MHCIATYLDSHLPRNPMYPEVCSHFTPPCCSSPFHTPNVAASHFTPNLQPLFLILSDRILLTTDITSFFVGCIPVSFSARMSSQTITSSPSNTPYFQGRTFTTQYFVQTPSKADTKKREYALFQSSIHPPHYKLLVGEEVWEVSYCVTS